MQEMQHLLVFQAKRFYIYKDVSLFRQVYSIGIAITVTEFLVGIFAFGLQNFKNMSNAQIASIPDIA